MDRIVTAMTNPRLLIQAMLSAAYESRVVLIVTSQPVRKIGFFDLESLHEQNNFKSSFVMIK